MPTPTEQKALAFLGIVILLGGAVRVLSAGGADAALPHERQALARQATAADSAANATASARTRPRRARVKAAKPGGNPIVVGGITTIPPYAGYNGFPPPGPRIDVDQRARIPTPAGRPRPGDPAVDQVDIDVALVADLTGLPRVGPALARRIVAHRDSFGPFGSLEALGRVRGIGPATLDLLAPLVTFSGRPSSRP